MYAACVLNHIYPVLFVFPQSCMDEGTEKSAMDLYFIDRAGENFKATVIYEPYFYIDVSNSSSMQELSLHLQKHFEKCRVEFVDLEDLDMPNHLSGKKHTFLKILFDTVAELQDCKQELKWVNYVLLKLFGFSYYSLFLIARNNIQQSRKENRADGDDANMDGDFEGQQSTSKSSNELVGPLRYITDLREHDVPYTIRCGIDMNLRAGSWYSVTPIEVSLAFFCVVEFFFSSHPYMD